MNPIETILQKSIADGIFPGVSLIAFAGDQIRFETHLGQAQNTPQTRPVTQNTIWDLASLSKPLSTASLCMRAFEAGLLDVDAPVSKYLPAFAKDLVTLSHLLNHSSGLPAWKAFYEKMPQNFIQTSQAKDWMVAEICKEPLEYETGSKVVYCDLGYILLGFILEKAFGKSQDILFQEQVAKPLGLTHTTYNPQTNLEFAATEFSKFRNRILNGEVDDDNTYVLGGVAGHAGIFSNVYDYFTWIRELNKARKGKSTWINRHTFEKFCTIPEHRKPNAPFFTLGFDTPVTGSSAGKYFSLQSLGHLGYAGTSFWWDLTSDFGVILLTNRVHPDPENNRIRSQRKVIHEIVCETLGFGL